MELADFLMELSGIPNEPCVFLMELCGRSIEPSGFLMRPAVFHTVLRGFAVEPSALPIEPGEFLGGVSGSRWPLPELRVPGVRGVEGQLQQLAGGDDGGVPARLDLGHR